MQEACRALCEPMGIKLSSCSSRCAFVRQHGETLRCSRASELLNREDVLARIDATLAATFLMSRPCRQCARRRRSALLWLLKGDSRSDESSRFLNIARVRTARIARAASLRARPKAISFDRRARLSSIVMRARSAACAWACATHFLRARRRLCACMTTCAKWPCAEKSYTSPAKRTFSLVLSRRKTSRFCRAWRACLPSCGRFCLPRTFLCAWRAI